MHLELPWQHWSLRRIVRLGDASYSIYLWHLLGFMISFSLSFKIGYHPDWLCEPWRFAANCRLRSFLNTYMEKDRDADDPARQPDLRVK